MEGNPLPEDFDFLPDPLAGAVSVLDRVHNLRCWAAWVLQANVCSHQFPLTVDWYHVNQGLEPPAEVRAVARAVVTSGRHYSASDIARLLLDQADEAERAGLSLPGPGPSDPHQ